MSHPTLLLLDEPSLGLAPTIIEAMYETFLRLRKEGLTNLLAEQSVELGLGSSGPGVRPASRAQRAVWQGARTFQRSGRATQLPRHHLALTGS
jgi:hypothetical protein